MFRLVALPLALFPVAALVAQEDRPESLDQRVPRLIARLGADDFGAREEASRALLELGEDAIPFLEAARDAGDPEVRQRIRLLLRRIARTGFPGRKAERRAELLRLEGGEGTEEAVDRGLDWLARHQSEGGLWDSDDFQAECAVNTCSGRGTEWADPAQTGLALLAFLGAGHGREDDAHGAAVRKGLAALVERQDDGGCIGPRTGHFLYNHAIATLALVDAFLLIGDEALRAPMEKAIGFLGEARNHDLAWRYGIAPGDNDTSVTSWALAAVLLAQRGGIAVPEGAMAGARNWFDSVTDANFRTGYIQAGDTGARLASQLGKYAPVESCTAIALASRIEMGADRKDALLAGQADLISNCLPEWDTNGGPGGTSRIDFYYWYQGTQAMFQYGGPRWETWNASLKTALVPHQRRDGDEAGSWDPIDAWGSEGGRVAGTALGVLALETYYRHPRVE